MYEGYYTLEDVAKLTGMTRSGVASRLWKQKPDMSQFKMHKIGQQKEYLFTLEQLQKYDLLKKNKFTEFKEIRKEKETQDIEELKKLHPLVTDVRLFKTSYFPDVIPNCYKEVEK